ncbi:MAG: CHRD domain-containing protein, partial [Polyangiales bacterium]
GRASAPTAGRGGAAAGSAAPAPTPGDDNNADNEDEEPARAGAAAPAGGSGGAPATTPADAGHGHEPAAGGGTVPPSTPDPTNSSAAAFNVPLTIEEEVPRCDAAAPTAAAIGSASVSADGQNISVVVSFAGLSGAATQAHIHRGPLGKQGPVVLDLGGDLTSPIRKNFKATEYVPTADGPATFSELVQAIKAGETYFNLHSQACAPGEIRGQIDALEPAPIEEDEAPAEIQVLRSKLTTVDEVPLCANASEMAVGAGAVAISSDRSLVAVRVAHSGLSGAPTDAHIHAGAPGFPGPIVLKLGPALSSTLVFTENDFTPVNGGPPTFDALLAAIEQGQTYFNVHTEACPTGEIRGQIVSDPQKWSTAPSEFQTRLRPEAELPPCEGAAEGGIGIGALVISPDQTQVAISIAHDGLSGAPKMAHIHFGAPDKNGPVVLDLGSELKSPIRVTLGKDDYKPTGDAPADFAGLIAAIRSGQTYFNLHTEACGMGEIRGQIVP